MREINLDRLRTLLTVADLGSFAAAAKVLHGRFYNGQQIYAEFQSEQAYDAHFGAAAAAAEGGS